MKWDLLFGRLLLIYQQPKTGSQTVEATLQGCALPHQIFRVHHLNQTSAQRIKSAVDSGQADEKWKRAAIPQLEMAEFLSKIVLRRKLLRSFGMPIPKLEVITGTRELISLALSSIFQNYSYFVRDPADLSVEVCREVLLRPKMFIALENWFEEELQRMAGVDVYRTGFPCEKGYTICENRQVRVLVYRIEALNNLPNMLHEFLGCEVPEIIQRNLGSSKGYAEQYAFVRQHLRLPPAFVTQKCGTKIMRHFYSETERRQFEQQWLSPSEAL